MEEPVDANVDAESLFGEETAEDGPENDEATEATEGQGQQGDGQEPAEKKRRVIRNPQPKLDPDRISGPRGIAVLQDIFKDFKPKGKGFEFDDLDLVLKRMEHWAHRLYPKLPFEDVTDRIADLGKKQAVKTYLKRLRLGMVTEVAKINEEDDEPVPQRYQDDVPADNEFETLMASQRIEEEEDQLLADLEATRMPSQAFSESGSAVNGKQSSSTQDMLQSQDSSQKILSAEVREMIEKNRQLAAERRKALERRRMQQQAEEEQRQKTCDE